MTIFNRVTRPDSLNPDWRRFHPRHLQLPGRSFRSLGYGLWRRGLLKIVEACLHRLPKNPEASATVIPNSDLGGGGICFSTGMPKKSRFLARQKQALRNESV